MKICILGIMNIKHMSLISLYTSFFDENKIDYDIIYVDKYNEVENSSAQNIYRYKMSLDKEWSKIRKLQEYLKFKSYAEEILSKEKYDYVIVWRSETALLFSKYLIKHYKDRYIVNIRDYCGEKNPFIFLRMKSILKFSLFTTISSNGFKSFLPNSRLLSVQSLNEKVLENLTPKDSLRKLNEPIRVCFIGYVRFIENDKKLIKALGNDPRYIIQFFGSGSKKLEEFAEENNIKNMEIVDNFKVEETGELLKRADVINNLYGKGDIALDTALSIKYYYALYMNLPILVYDETFMEEVTTRIGIGYSFNNQYENLADDFYNWYHNINFSEFKINNIKEITYIRQENKLFYDKINEVFKNVSGKI